MSVSEEGRRFEVLRFRGTDEEVRAQWLAARKAGVGGSDVAAVMGISAYKGAYTLWAEKTGAVDTEDVASQAAEWGNRLEPLVAAKYKENHPGYQVKRLNGLCRSVERPWALASLDYQVLDKDGAGHGILECKTVGVRRAGDWAEGVPLYYQTQVQHYMDVLDRSWCDVAVLIGGQEYREYRIEADAEDQAAIRAAVDEFWSLVESNTPPDPAGLDQAAVFARHADAGEFEEVSDAAEVDEVAAWMAAKKAADLAKAELDEAAAALKERIGDARGFDSPTCRVTWKRGRRASFERKRFEEEHPGMYELYSTERPADYGLAVTIKKG